MSMSNTYLSQTFDRAPLEDALEHFKTISPNVFYSYLASIYFKILIPDRFLLNVSTTVYVQDAMHSVTSTSLRS